ncbi:MAG: ATP-binding protein [Candidatus Limivicinus sp.]|jgi:uncharacterized protein YhaN
MKINKLTASFGKLENESLSFHDGLNIISAPNESGKTTWCAFIRAMLYGVDSSRRARADSLPDKLRYAPWSGAPMEGSMELTAGGSDITVTRTTNAKNAPMREFSAVYTGSGLPVEGLNSVNAGEKLTGITKEFFIRSAFIPQGSLAVTDDPELERRIAAIVSSGEEDSSYTEADDRLSLWQRRRRFNQHGYIPRLEGEMDGAKQKLSEMSAALQETERLENELEKSRERCRELEAAVTESRKRQRKSALEKLSSGRAELKKCSEEHNASLSALAEKKETLRKNRFGVLRPDQAEAAVSGDIEELERLGQSCKKKASPIPAIILFIFGAVCAAFSFILRQIYLMIPAAVSCTAAVVFSIRCSKLRHKVRDAENARDAILEKYNVHSAEEIDTALREHGELYGAALSALQKEQNCRLAWENARDRLGQLEESAMSDLDFSGGSSEAAILGRRLNSERQAAGQISARISELRGKIAATGDPLVISSALKSMEEEYDELAEEYDAIGLARDVLKEADTEIQSRFSPRLGRLAAQYMSLVTGGRYSELLLNRDFSGKLRRTDEAVARDSRYLSAGTLDLMYLALRLAVCELALPAGESCPLIIDDALVNLDETRCAQAIELLKEIAKKRQVILFTCRESKI